MAHTIGQEKKKLNSRSSSSEPSMVKDRAHPLQKVWYIIRSKRENEILVIYYCEGSSKASVIILSGKRISSCHCRRYWADVHFFRPSHFCLKSPAAFFLYRFSSDLFRRQNMHIQVFPHSDMQVSSWPCQVKPHQLWLLTGNPSRCTSGSMRAGESERTLSNTHSLTAYRLVGDIFIYLTSCYVQ